MGIMKWLTVCVLLSVYSQGVTASGFTVSVFSATSKTMTLRWTKVAGATSYKISVALQSSPGNTVAFAQFGPNTVMGSINSLSPNLNYVVTVEALDNMGLPLDNASTPPTTTAPATMGPIQTVKPKDSTTLMVEFSPQSDATSYIVRVQNNNGFHREVEVAGSPAEIPSLQPYTQYQLSVMAQNQGGRTQPSASVDAKTVLPAPQLSASSPCNSSIAVSWAPVAHAVLYTLSVTKFNTSTNMKFNTSDTNMTVTGLDAGALYVIGGYAWDPEDRKGDASAYINQTTRPATPSGVNISVAMNGSVAELSVSWETDPDVYGPVHYSVTSDLQGLSCNSSSAPSCVLSPVSCGQVHNIWVTAANDAGPSHPFGPETFITFPCPPHSLALVEPTGGNCTLSWSSVMYADGYNAFIKRGDGVEEIHNTSASNSSFHCQCGRTYLMSVRAFNGAGSSVNGESFNYTTLPCCPEGVSVSSVSTDTLEITWTAARGAEVYETRAVDGSEVVLCNDTAPVCALSDLSCDSAYSVVVTPCNDISGCNRGCPVHTKNTAPCTPTNMVLDLKNSSCLGVSWTGNNSAANYTVKAVGDEGTFTCSATAGTGCDITGLPCGCTFDVSVYAHNAAGRSLPSYSQTLETEPCCPANLTVAQVTQSMTNVSWSEAKGARSFVTSLTSSRGHARCHTQDSHCLMGCITCGTNYTVAMEAVSHSGRKTNCTYQGFSSSACCPSGVRLYKLSAPNSMRVYWRNSGGGHSHEVELLGSSNNYTCSASAGDSSCDVANIQCGDTYHVVVAPLTAGGSKVLFCAQRMYSVICQDNNDIGTVVYRGKRSVD